jgi:hypothetical protein
MNMTTRLLALVVVAVFVSGVAAYSHHSFAGTYREGELMTIEGTVAEFMIRNPHSFISIEVTNDDGSVTRWGGEWGGVTQLSQGGVDRFTLKIGDTIIIEGAPPRDTLDHKVLVRKVTRPATASEEEFVWQGRVN